MLAYDVTVSGKAIFLNLQTAAIDFFRAGGNADSSLQTVTDFARKDLDTYGQYTLQVSPTLAPTRGIAEHIKLYSKPYLPGSSLKGAIRTALIEETLSQGKKEEFEEAIRASLASEDVSKPHLSDKAEEAVWAKDPHHDPLRGLRVSDSAEVSPSDYLTISDVRVMGFNLDPPKLFWEQLGRRGWHHDTPDEATRIFLETLTPRTILEGELVRDLTPHERARAKDSLRFPSRY